MQKVLTKGTMPTETIWHHFYINDIIVADNSTSLYER